MATAAELAELIEPDVVRALATADVARRQTLLRAAGRAAFEIAYEDAGGDPRVAESEAAAFTNTLAGAMNQTFPDGTEEQASRIAAIWAQAASNGAVVAAAPLGQRPTRTWITMLDDKVRELHQPMHGVTIAAGERFNVGGYQLRYPGEPVGPPEVWINCRCSVALGQSSIAADAAPSTKEAPVADKTPPWLKDQDTEECPEGQHRDEETGECVDDETLVARTYNADQRKKMANSGTAMKDGSFPIADVEDLRNAIQAIGRAKDPDAAKRHIRKRARALGAENLIPDSWSASAASSGWDPYDHPDEPLAAATGSSNDSLMAWPPSTSPPGTHDAPGWLTHPRETERLRRYWVRGPGAAKIGWGSPNDLTRCHKHLAKYVGPFAWGTCQNLHKEALGYWNPESRPSRRSDAELVASAEDDTSPETLALIEAAFAAADALEDEMETPHALNPPAEWFEDPGFDAKTPLTITSDGRVLGHLASWDTCHVGITGECITPPHSQTNYAHFRLGEVETREGTTVPVGQITMDTGHAGKDDSPLVAVSHYDDTGTAVCDVACGEDEFGIWVAGAMRPGVSELQMYNLKATGKLSGDWRRIGGNLELVAALAVNVPGYPIPRLEVAASAGRTMSLVAAAVVGVDPNAIEDDRLVVAVQRAMDQRDQAQDRARRASALIATDRELRVERLLELVR